MGEGRGRCDQVRAWRGSAVRAGHAVLLGSRCSVYTVGIQIRVCVERLGGQDIRLRVQNRGLNCD